MKIVLFDPITGGHHEKYASFLVRYFKEKGDEVFFVGWKENDLNRHLGQRGASLRFVKPESSSEFGGGGFKKNLQMYQAINYLFEVAKKESVDIVHHLYLERSELPLMLNMLLRADYDFEIFGTLFWPYFLGENAQNSPFHTKVYYQTNKKSLNWMLNSGRMSCLFVHTENIKKKLISGLDKGYYEDLIGVVPDPIEIPETIQKKEARKSLDLPVEKPIILFFGGLRKDKGPDIFLESLTSLKNDPLCAVVAGTPQYLSQSEIESYEERTPENVELVKRLGRIPKEDVNNYFYASDLIVLPYRKSFLGTSGILHHAAATQRPVVATDVGEVGAIIRDNELGVVVKKVTSTAIANGITKFFELDPEERQRLKSNNAAYAKKQSWEKMAKKVRKVYKKA